MTTTTAYLANGCSSSTFNTFNDFLTCANQSGAGFLFAGIDFLVFFVLLITLTGTFGWESALLSSSFISLILSLLFSYMGVLSWWFTGIFVGLIILSILYVMFSRKE